jgi:hypothetical protein
VPPWCWSPLTAATDATVLKLPAQMERIRHHPEQVETVEPNLILAVLEPPATREAPSPCTRCGGLVGEGSAEMIGDGCSYKRIGENLLPPAQSHALW